MRITDGEGGDGVDVRLRWGGEGSEYIPPVMAGISILTFVIGYMPTLWKEYTFPFVMEYIPTLWG